MNVRRFIKAFKAAWSGPTTIMVGGIKFPHTDHGVKWSARSVNHGLRSQITGKITFEERHFGQTIEFDKFLEELTPWDVKTAKAEILKAAEIHFGLL